MKVATSLLLSGLFALSTATQQDSIDWRATKHGNLISPVRNLNGLPGKKCAGSGWSFAATSMVSDRLAILQPLVPKVQLSNQVLLNCATSENVNGCATGNIEQALRFIMDNNGIPDRTCTIYKAEPDVCSSMTMCMNCLPEKCEARPAYIKYPIESYRRLKISNKSLKKEIAVGPIACEFKNEARFGTVVGFTSNDTYVAKYELGVFYGERGYGNVALDDVKECWSAVVAAPYRHIDQEVKESKEKKTVKKTSAFEGSKLSLREDFYVTPLSLEDRRSLGDLPTNFSWLNKNLLTPVQSHHNGAVNKNIYCGGCWSEASSSAFSDRLRILQGPNSTDVFVSPQNTIDCVKGDHSDGCNGGDAPDVFEHFKNFGTVEETCNEWATGEQQCVDNGRYCKSCDANGKCTAVDKSKYKVYRSKEWGNIKSEASMMQEIFKRGPIVCGIATPPALDELSWGSDIICDEDTPPQKWSITHDVTIVGWGETTNGEKYWIMRNSWSTAYGGASNYTLENAAELPGGFARVCRGKNAPGGNMLLESACSFVVPEVY